MTQYTDWANANCDPYEDAVACPDCDGTGVAYGFPVGVECLGCNGTGFVPDEEDELFPMGTVGDLNAIAERSKEWTGTWGQSVIAKLVDELHAERHARTQERAQADARIAELEAELKAAKEWIEAVPVNAIEYMRGNSTCAHFPTPQGYWERQDLINAWLDALAESEAV